MTKLCECGCGKPTRLAPKTDRRVGHIKGEPQRFLAGHCPGGFKFGHKIRLTHGMTGTPEYDAYNSAKERCLVPTRKGYKDYGGRGIKFLFTSFEQFFKEIGPRPKGKTLDRKDNDGNYEPGNVRWATLKEQMNNTRRKRLSQFTLEELLEEVSKRQAAKQAKRAEKRAEEKESNEAQV